MLAALWRLLFALLLLCMALAIVGFHEQANLAWVKQAAQATLTTLCEAFAAFLVFVVVFCLAVLVLAFFFDRWQVRQGRLLALTAVFLVGLVLFNSLPIVFYIEKLKELGWPPFIIASTSLLMANAMLYYFFSSFLFDLLHEAKRPYALSAPFKDARPVGYLVERAVWAFLASLSTLFYYLFSFTLFTDYMLQGFGGRTSVGVVGRVFGKLERDSTATALWEPGVYMLTALAIIIPVRALLDFALAMWEKRCNIKRMVSGA